MSQARFENNSISIDARAVAKSLDLDAADVLSLIREGKITSTCERGVDEDAGTYRLTFFHASRRVRLIIGEGGNIIRRSTIDFGDRPTPGAYRKGRR
jgi:hypothetical protein